MRPYHSLSLDNVDASHLMISGSLVAVLELWRNGWCQRWLWGFVFRFCGPMVISNELLHLIRNARDEWVCASTAWTINHWMRLNVLVLEQALIRNFVLHYIQTGVRVLADRALSPLIFFSQARIRPLFLDNMSPIFGRQVKFVALMVVFDLMSLYHWAYLMTIDWTSFSVVQHIKNSFRFLSILKLARFQNIGFILPVRFIFWPLGENINFFVWKFMFMLIILSIFKGRCLLVLSVRLLIFWLFIEIVVFVVAVEDSHFFDFLFD